jgi:dihydroneopterin aldolase
MCARMVEYTILLEGLEVTIGLGIHDHERAAPQRVTVSVWLTCGYDAVPQDRIEAVVDYDYLREGIRALSEARHIELQETLCEEVAQLALAADPRVRTVKVRSMKLDVYPDARVGCEVVRSAGERE